MHNLRDLFSLLNPYAHILDASDDNVKIIHTFSSFSKETISVVALLNQKSIKKKLYFLIFRANPFPESCTNMHYNMQICQCYCNQALGSAI